jgi:fibronectin-binding autotransporter adhesin
MRPEAPYEKSTLGRGINMFKSTTISACAIIALAGTSAGAQVINWITPVDGNWNDPTKWDGANVPNAIGEDAVLGLAGPYTVTTTSLFNFGSLTISNAQATLSIGTVTHTLNGDLLNNGTVFVNTDGSISNSALSFGADATISGSGSILLNAQSEPGDAQIVANSFTINHALGHTIHGSGHITGAMFNSGSIVADIPGGVGLRLAGTLSQDATGTASADAGKLILGNGSITTGGTLATLNGGVIEVENSATIANITNTGDLNIPGQGWFLLLNDNVTNDGTVHVNSNNNIFNAHIRFDTSSTLGGSGTVSMVSVGNLDDAQVLTNTGIVGTIGANQTLEGSGSITGANGGTIANNGTINANDPVNGLGLIGSHDGSGGGVYRSDDGILGLSNGLVLDGGTFDSSGVGIVDMTTNGVATLSNVTNLGEMGIRGQGGSIGLVGPMANDGTLTINSNNNIFNAHLRFDASTTINGSGTVRMFSAGDLADAQLFTNGLFVGTIGANQTVAGSGIVDGRSGGTIANTGTINGDHAAVGKNPAIELRLQGNHDGSGGGVYRSDDGILGLSSGLILDGGTFDSSGVGIVDMTTNGVATLSNVTNLGVMGIRGQGGVVSLVGPMTNDGTLSINSNNNIFNAHLRFDASTAINGTGVVRMVSAGDLADAQLFTNGVFNGTIGASQTVAGSGLVDGRSGGTIVNNGTINGDDPNFELRLQGNHDGSGGGVYRADEGVLGFASGSIFTGGTFDSSGAGIVDMTTNGTATLSGVTNIGTMGIRGQGGIVGLTGPLTNNGLIKINSNNNIFNAHIRFLSATEIDGTGTIDMLVTSDFGDAQILNDQGFVGTIGDGQTITGSGRLQGEMNMDGTLDPGSTFRRFDIDTLHLSPTSGFIADIGGTAGGEFDRLLLGGGDNIDLDGTLTVNLDSGYVPVFGDTWDIVDGGTINGIFATENVPPAGLGQVYRVIYQSNRVYVILTCDADLNGDNTLDFFDVSAFLGFFSAEDVRGDLTGDGQFNFFDISLFLQLFSGGCAG